MTRLCAALVRSLIPASLAGLRRVPPFPGPRLSRRLAVSVGVVVLALAASRGAGRATGPAAMSVAPATASTGVGGDITLDVTASNVSAPGLGGYVIVLTWDPAVLTMTSLTDSGWVTGGNIIVICTTPDMNNIVGTAELDCTPLFGFGDGVTTSGPQALAQAVFQATALGTTAIDLTGSSLLDLNGADLVPASTLTNGSAIVAPIAVGGAVEPPHIAALPAPASGAPGARRSAYTGLAAGAALLAVASLFGWTARRRR